MCKSRHMIGNDEPPAGSVSAENPRVTDRLCAFKQARLDVAEEEAVQAVLGYLRGL
jgi:hypothetical protein